MTELRISEYAGTKEDFIYIYTYIYISDTHATLDQFVFPIACKLICGQEQYGKNDEGRG